MAEEKKTPEDFIKAYEKLSEEYGVQVVPLLKWVQRDDGSWSTLVNLEIIEKPNDSK